MTPAALEAIRERLAKATPGPWHADSRGREFSERDPEHYVVEADLNGLPSVVVDTLNCDVCFPPDEQRANAALIASAPTDLQACLSHIDTLREALRPFARLPLSTEHFATTDMYITPADQLRDKAMEIERRDAFIGAARRALGDHP
jgi:hypothetical protein